MFGLRYATAPFDDVADTRRKHLALLRKRLRTIGPSDRPALRAVIALLEKELRDERTTHPVG